jgi:F0F1-type ATP synthase membrane subunit c/vacuolar-type H+-ATPase subunit K
MFRTLDAGKIVHSLEQLTRRIDERFAGAGLAKVSLELTGIARDSGARSALIAKPAIFTRALVTLVFFAGFSLLAFVFHLLLSKTKASDDLFGTIQGIDAGFNIVVLTGATLFFMFSVEERAKRRRALRALHELRSIVHVIDMHQLTKDPSAAAAVTSATPSSPKRTLTPFELTRYLDYCSEMLSLTAKVAVLYAQSFPDPVVTETVNDIERTAASLSQKIWQKIMIIEAEIRHEEMMAHLKAPQPAGSRPVATQPDVAAKVAQPV